MNFVKGALLVSLGVLFGFASGLQYSQNKVEVYKNIAQKSFSVSDEAMKTVDQYEDLTQKCLDLARKQDMYIHTIEN